MAYPNLAAPTAPPASLALAGYTDSVVSGGTAYNPSACPPEETKPLVPTVPVVPQVAGVPAGPVVQAQRPAAPPPFPAAPPPPRRETSRAPIQVADRPNGFVGGCLGAVIGQVVLPIPVIGAILGGLVGRGIQRNRGKAANTVYLKPVENAPAVPVKLWKLGETAPLSDSGLQLVLEARTPAELTTFLHRLIQARNGYVRWGQTSELKTYAAHVVAVAALDITCQTVLEQLTARNIVSAR